MTEDRKKIVGRLIGAALVFAFFFGPPIAIAVMAWWSEPELPFTTRVAGSVVAFLGTFLVIVTVGRFFSLAYDVITEKEPKS